MDGTRRCDVILIHFAHSIYSSTGGALRVCLTCYHRHHSTIVSANPEAEFTWKRIRLVWCTFFPNHVPISSEINCPLWRFIILKLYYYFIHFIKFIGQCWKVLLWHLCTTTSRWALAFLCRCGHTFAPRQEAAIIKNHYVRLLWHLFIVIVCEWVCIMMLHILTFSFFLNQANQASGQFHNG